jgi:hypothetical protein
MAVVDRVGYAERRAYVVPGSLAELAGPAGGVVRLPPALAWTGRAEYDLDDDADRIVFYERVLVEATDVASVTALLNEDLLRAYWGRLFLPAPVRRAWERRFAGLTSAA